jgi:hypothetical protein
LNTDSARVFKAAQASHLLLDWTPSTRILVLLANDGTDRRCYKLAFNQGGGATFSGRAFLSHIEWPKHKGDRLEVVEVGRGTIKTRIPDPAAKSTARTREATAASAKMRAERQAKG